MAEFSFRLEKVLEFRAGLEAAAKTAYLAKRSEVLATEAQISHLKGARLDALSERRSNIDEFRMLEMLLLRYDDDERALNLILSVLNDEAEQLRQGWIRQKQDYETVAKLRERAYAEWQYEEARREQAELDEWAVLRRAS